MTGLRERSKQRRREAALAAARVLFAENGYSQTTIEEIATRADISIGTLYTYFGSKGGIFFALIQPMIEAMRAKAARIIANPPADPVDAIAAMYEAYRFTDEWSDLKVWDAFRSEMGSPAPRESDPAIESVRGAFEEFIGAQFEELLQKLIDDGKLSYAINLEDARFILFNFLLAHFDAFIRSAGAMPYEQMVVDLHRRLRTLFLLGK